MPQRKLVGNAEQLVAASADSPADRRTHILFLIDQLCGSGGAERSLLRILEFLPKDRFRCSVISFKVDTNWSAFENFPCPWQQLPLQCTYDWNALRMALRLRRLIRSEKVDIVHTFFETSDIWGGIVAKLSGAPVLISSRRDMGILRNRMHRFAYRVLAPMFDLVLTVSEEVRTFCIQHDCIQPEKVQTLHNAIDLERFPTTLSGPGSRHLLGLGSASHLICSIGHVRRVKGFDVVIRAAKSVCAEFPGAIFVIVGGVLEPDHLKELQALSQSLGLQDNLRFTGPLEDVTSILCVSDIYCAASRSEGFSNALLEAMACSVPCIATRVGGNPEAVVDTQTGFLVDSEDPEMLADRIRTLLRDPALAKSMGHEGRRVVEANFTVKTMISRLGYIYDTTS